jgi:hypothetical protein
MSFRLAKADSKFIEIDWKQSIGNALAQEGAQEAQENDVSALRRDGVAVREPFRSADGSLAA